ncbi:MAG: hypothetical protein IIC51_07785 [Planctomycetes bacterium]|nr:hypothetical protein [Planctomycetota bacterium]
MEATFKMHMNIDRLEYQRQRLRNRLANALQCGFSAPVIGRLESLLQHRWRLLDRAREQTPPTVPE